MFRAAVLLLLVILAGCKSPATGTPDSPFDLDMVYYRDQEAMVCFAVPVGKGMEAITEVDCTFGVAEIIERQEAEYFRRK